MKIANGPKIGTTKLPSHILNSFPLTACPRYVPMTSHNTVFTTATANKQRRPISIYTPTPVLSFQ